MTPAGRAAFLDQRDSRDDFLMQHAHVPTRFLIAFTHLDAQQVDFTSQIRAQIYAHPLVARADLFACRREFTPHLVPELQNLRLDGGDPNTQRLDSVHSMLENLDPFLE
jgi:hypothetical protein